MAFDCPCKSLPVWVKVVYSRPSLIRNRDAYRDVTISGKDANGATMLFNPDAVLRKINVRAKMNNNGTFNEKDVWEKVKKELKKI